jgi:hypothetical protein
LRRRSYHIYLEDAERVSEGGRESDKKRGTVDIPRHSTHPMTTFYAERIDDCVRVHVGNPLTIEMTVKFGSSQIYDDYQRAIQYKVYTSRDGRHVDVMEIHRDGMRRQLQEVDQRSFYMGMMKRNPSDVYQETDSFEAAVHKATQMMME